MSNSRPVTLITGASAGIGAALARVFAANGHELMLVARRRTALDALAGEIAARGGKRAHVLDLDLAAPGAARRIGEAMAAAGVEPDCVVNNAGFGLLGNAAERDTQEQLAMIDVNVRALTELSLAWIEILKRRRGGILNVASVAAFVPGPRMAVYYATKAYVLSFSQALGYELKDSGVRVCALCPGPVPTEFQARAGFQADRRTSRQSLPAERVAEAGYRGLMRGDAVAIPGFYNKVVAIGTRFIPRKHLLALVDNWQRRRQPPEPSPPA